MRRTSLTLGALCLSLAMGSGCAFLKKNVGTPDIDTPKIETPKIETPKVETPDGEDAVKAVGNVSASAKKAIDEVEAWKDSEERAVGDGIAIQLAAASGGLVTDWRVTEYLNDVANVVGLEGQRRENKGNRGQDRRFVVGLLKTGEINAFACPGGFIFITKGLLARLHNEAELAFVLAHEVAHVDEEHALTYVKLQLGTAGAAEALASEATGGTSKMIDNPKIYAFLGDQVVKGIQAVGFGKKAELTADEKAVAMMKAAGYDPAAAGRVLDMLAANEQKAPTIGKTHPKATARKEALAGTMDGGGATHAGRYDAIIRTQLAKRK